MNEVVDPVVLPPQPQPQFQNRIWSHVGLGCLGCGCFSVLAGLGFLIVLFIAFIGHLEEAMEKASNPEEGLPDLEPAKMLNLDLPAETEETSLVLYVPVKGTIMESAGESLFNMPMKGDCRTALRDIRMAVHDERIRGLFLEIDSPGGEVTLSDIIWKAIQDFKAADEDRYVVALFQSQAASGAYYIATAADCIVAHPTTLTGSIGVILESINIKDLADRLGVKSVAITSGANKTILSPFETMTEEQKRILQRVVDADYSRFVSLVAKGRHLPEAKVRVLADGRVFGAKDALSEGLVDKLGYFSDVRSEFVRAFAGEPEFVEYTLNGSFWRALFDPNYVGACLHKAIRLECEFSQRKIGETRKTF
ncbi:MAG: signal peptide peptidase SppA [Kiritimatiellia bacterium]